MTSLNTMPSVSDSCVETMLKEIRIKDDGRSAGRNAARRVIALLDRPSLKQRARDFAKAIETATKRRDRQRRKALDVARRRNAKIDAEFAAAHDVAWEAFTGRKP